MGQIVVNGGAATCSMGTAPGTITATTQQKVLAGGMPAATIQDFSMAAISPFGLCTSILNPAVQTATLAAMGVLQPQPCTMTPNGTWVAQKPSVTVGGSPVLTSDCQGTCAYGGCITVVNPGQTKVML